MRKYCALFVMTIVLFASGPAAFAKDEEKEPVVAMPLIASGGVARDDALGFESALIEALSGKYKVYSGKKVQDTVEKVYKKRSAEAKAGKECDDTKCLQDIAMEFQSELIAICTVKKMANGYMLSLKIQNVVEDTVPFSKAVPCENCNDFAAMRALQEIVSGEAPAKPVSLLVSADFFQFNGRKMNEWQPLLTMLKEENATITEATGNVDAGDFDILFWDACETDRTILFPQLRSLLKAGKVVILSGTNSCLRTVNGQDMYSSELANEVLRDFGMEFSKDDPGNEVAYASGDHSIIDGVESFLTFRSPHINVLDHRRVKVLAESGQGVHLALYTDKASKGLLIATGLGDSWLYGVHNKRAPEEKAYDTLPIMRNIIAYKRSMNAKK